MALIDQFITAIKPHIDFKTIKVIWDIGSRDLGQSMELHSVFPQAKIYAFEPNPDSFEKCLEIKPDYITLLPYALLDYDGETEFYSVRQTDNHGASSVFPPTDNLVGVDLVDGVAKIKVTCREASSVIEELGRAPDLIWADVQGSELLTLKGFGKYLNKVKAIATEAETGVLYYPNRQAEPTQYAELKRFLESKGFKEVLYLQPWPLECDTSWVKV